MELCTSGHVPDVTGGGVGGGDVGGGGEGVGGGGGGSCGGDGGVNMQMHGQREEHEPALLTPKT